ncbi:triacylglycerol lipase [Ancylostoma caninum]|uniref:Triacylglycerol lipase n=1 Tax=Ancylostoma caninum TaxID=29170 RepID=A0A368H797_ANCCA|nr:triacylglycerol lipase [Ancylostoma caninum]
MVALIALFLPVVVCVEEDTSEERKFDFTNYDEDFARDVMFPISAAAYSSTPHECLRNLFGNVTSKWDYGGHVSHYFHRAFQLIWDGLEIGVYHYMRQHPDWDVWISGHSLGGALATLASFFLVHQKLVEPDKLKLITFGEPRIGDKEFAEAFNDMDIYDYRVVHWRDLVPSIPSTGYWHQGQEVTASIFC